MGRMGWEGEYGGNRARSEVKRATSPMSVDISIHQVGRRVRGHRKCWLFAHISVLTVMLYAGVIDQARTRYAGQTRQRVIGDTLGNNSVHLPIRPASHCRW